MARLVRLLYGFLIPLLAGPFAIAVLLPVLYYFRVGEFSTEMKSVSGLFEYFSAILVVGIMMGAAPMLIYSLTMEFVVNPLVKRHALVVLISGLIGGTVALIPIRLLTVAKDYFTLENTMISMVGLLVGLLSGWVLRRRYLSDTSAVQA